MDSKQKHWLIKDPCISVASLYLPSPVTDFSLLSHFVFPVAPTPTIRNSRVAVVDLGKQSLRTCNMSCTSSPLLRSTFNSIMSEASLVTLVSLSQNGAKFLIDTITTSQKNPKSQNAKSHKSQVPKIPILQIPSSKNPNPPNLKIPSPQNPKFKNIKSQDVNAEI